jgi:hypothetical protein
MVFSVGDGRSSGRQGRQIHARVGRSMGAYWGEFQISTVLSIFERKC